MTARVVHQPTEAHHCRVGWRPVPLPEDHPERSTGAESYLVAHGQSDPPGTVRECDTCGKTWVAYKPRDFGALATQWRPEGRFERWRRERRQARTAGVHTTTEGDQA